MTLLSFLSRCLGPLKGTLGLAHVLDAGLLVLTALSSPRVFRALLRLIGTVGRWPGVRESPHRYGGVQFNVAGREIGHVHGNGVVDIRFSRRLRDALVRAGQAQTHHTFPDSGWVSLPIRSAADAGRARRLLQLSYDAPSEDGHGAV
jgi:hypothetical protein